MIGATSTHAPRRPDRPASIQRFDFELLADYHQFYVWDGGVDPEAPVDWTKEDVARRAKVAPNVVVICPLRDMTVPVTLEIHDREPEFDPSGVDHVVRCGLALPTGELQVHECTGSEVFREQVKPGNYGVLAIYGGLATIDETGLEGQDLYRIVLWPVSEVPPLEVVKAWEERL